MENDFLFDSNIHHYYNHGNNFHYHQIDEDYYNYSNFDVLNIGYYVVDQIDDEYNVDVNDLWNNVMELFHHELVDVNFHLYGYVYSKLKKINKYLHFYYL